MKEIVDFEKLEEWLDPDQRPAYLKDIEMRLIYRINGGEYAKDSKSVRCIMPFVVAPTFSKYCGWSYETYKEAERVFFLDKEKPFGSYTIQQYLMQAYPYSSICMYTEIISDISEMLEKGVFFDLSESDFYYTPEVESPITDEYVYKQYYSNRKSNPEPKSNGDAPSLISRKVFDWHFFEWRGDITKPIYVSKDGLSSTGVGPFIDAGIGVAPMSISDDNYAEGFMEMHFPDDSSLWWEMCDGTKVLKKPYNQARG